MNVVRAQINKDAGTAIHLSAPLSFSIINVGELLALITRHLIGRNDLLLLLGQINPLLDLLRAQQMVNIGLRVLALDLVPQRVCQKTERQGCVHGIDGSEATEQESLVAFLANLLGSKVLPDARDTGQLCDGVLGVEFGIKGVPSTDVHSVLTDPIEASRHLCSKRASEGAVVAVGRPDLGIIYLLLVFFRMR